MTGNEFLYIILALTGLGFLIDQVIDYLNIKYLKEELPGELANIYEESKYQKSIQYQRANARFGFITSLMSFTASFGLLAFGGFGWIHRLLATYVTSTSWLPLVFFGALFITSDILTTPFQWYNTFRLEARYGFNKTTLRTFIFDKLKGYGLGVLLGGPLLALFIFLLNQMGKDFWWIFWLAMTAFSLFMNVFYSSLILPIFNKLTPLQDGNLKSSIEEYARKVDFPLTNILVMDGSRRSSKSNAFFSGFGKQKKVVLFDTLIEKHSTDELVSVLAHEVGHYKKQHILGGFLLSTVQTGLMLFLMQFIIFNEELSFALGGTEYAIHLNLIAFAILYGPISTILGLIGNYISRKNEYEADAYATRTFGGEPLQSALKKLSVHNLSNLMPHPWYVFFNFSHPPLLQRLKAIDRIQNL
ncbi:MAG TPA: peptidase M48 [Cytophagales bacterium]|nr:peptidase M48 [Cytophagales bacterium]HAA19505.1 peptidase M48 [Cytophagales bacterium]HAP59621.1 peptidase M48 [Cytophagales bacterium]